LEYRNAPPASERRNAVGEIRAVGDDTGTPSVTLRAIRPDVVDDYGSVWMADCFDEALSQRLPALVWAHDWSNPIGRGVDYRTSGDGPDVIFEFDDFDAVPTARRAYVQTKSGTIRDCSVGFSVPSGGRREPTADEQQKWPGVREVITRAELDEVSLVLRGAVPGAKVLAVRSGAMVPAQLAGDLLAQLGAGTITLEDALRQAREGAVAETGEQAPGGEETPPGEPTPEEVEAAAAAEVAAVALDAEADDALALVSDRSR
jgi:HK97 family phage prohead protease